MLLIVVKIGLDEEISKSPSTAVSDLKFPTLVLFNKPHGLLEE